jgi:hypothetical protein
MPTPIVVNIYQRAMKSAAVTVPVAFTTLIWTGKKEALAMFLKTTSFPSAVFKFTSPPVPINIIQGSLATWLYMI